MTNSNSYYFSGIGGSGMLPLAILAKGRGDTVVGSDRAHDQGRTADKFLWLQSQSIPLFAQDGSGVMSADQIIVASAAVEKTVPDMARAQELGCTRMTRAELLAEMLNGAAHSIAVGGTSGKSTVTGMIGWILTEAGADPTIMNGAVMKNFTSDDAPFASARIGHGDSFVSEVDESDGSIALFRPSIAVLNNVSLDHKTLEELHQLFGDFLSVAKQAIWNADDAESRLLVGTLALKSAISFGTVASADVRATAIEALPLGSLFTLNVAGKTLPVQLQVPGAHNIANALAAAAACHAMGVNPDAIAAGLQGFAGLRRRFEIVGTANGITVIDDFGHNPEKIAATLATLKQFPGRLLIFFQPHGYGPIRLMGAELAAMFVQQMGQEDQLFLCDPVYFGGTVDKTIGSNFVTDAVTSAGRTAHHISTREAIAAHIESIAIPGDRIVIMGARDDSLPAYARDLLGQLMAAGT
jgi:UDP-N-acetylmuramate--alanine ligase